MASTAVFASLLTTGAGHGVMYEPPVRNSFGMKFLTPACAGGSCLWFNQGCTIGCPFCSGSGSVYPSEPDCKDHAKPTLAFSDTADRTYELSIMSAVDDWTKYHPWRYPGAAPVLDPCGISGGWFFEGSPGNGGEAPIGVPQGVKGSEFLPKLLDETVWIAGSVVEVAWGITANHGGGYQYRLCPTGETLSESCFQKIPLKFHGETQWLQHGLGMNVSDRQEIPARTISGAKVVPIHSQWRRNPIPSCDTPIAGGAIRSPCPGPVFKPPIKGGRGVAYGFGSGTCQSEGLPIPDCSDKDFANEYFDFGIVDKLEVPADLPEGDYVLSFRWDVEQTPQVWTSCADVTIKKSGPATAAFSPGHGCTACCHEMGICSNCTGCANDKTGACAYCWEPLQGYHPGVPDITCLGWETEEGKAPEWYPGMDTSKGAPGLSPGCTACWANGCPSGPRDADQSSKDMSV